MKAAFLLCIVLAAFPARSCHAQAARAHVTASVAIVEAIGVAAGATTVTPAAGATLDVTTPLSIRGSAPRVVQVMDAEAARPISTQLQPSCPPAAGSAQPEACPVRARLSSEDADGEKRLTYMVATVN